MKPSGCFPARSLNCNRCSAVKLRPVNLKIPPGSSSGTTRNFPASYLNHGAALAPALSEATRRRADALSSEITGRLLSQERRTNDPPGCPDSLRTTTLCSRERSWHERRFRASVSCTARPGVARAHSRGCGEVLEGRGREGESRRWREGEMKTLVVRHRRRAALSSREPKINRSPRLPETPSSNLT